MLQLPTCESRLQQPTLLVMEQAKASKYRLYSGLVRSLTYFKFRFLKGPQQAQQQRDDLSRRYERGLTDQQRRQLQQQAEQIRQDNRQREEERKKQQERNKGKDKGLER